MFGVIRMKWMSPVRKRNQIWVVDIMTNHGHPEERSQSHIIHPSLVIQFHNPRHSTDWSKKKGDQSFCFLLSTPPSKTLCLQLKKICFASILQYMQWLLATAMTWFLYSSINECTQTGKRLKVYHHLIMQQCPKPQKQS